MRPIPCGGLVAQEGALFRIKKWFLQSSCLKKKEFVVQWGPDHDKTGAFLRDL